MPALMARATGSPIDEQCVVIIHGKRLSADDGSHQLE
jgi:hypothetical protein